MKGKDQKPKEKERMEMKETETLAKILKIEHKGTETTRSENMRGNQRN